MMFRVQRELYVLEVLKIEVLWLAWADSLILLSVALAVFGATVPLLVVRASSPFVVALAAASCVAALILQAGYLPAILAHYRIWLGGTRHGPRERGEPIERRVVIGSIVCAAALFGATLLLRLGVS
jgi:hypothetical protein